MLRLARHPRLWLAACCAWFAVLWVLSSFHSVGPPIPVEGFDKLEHFLYFFGGGALFTGWRFLLRPEDPDWRKLILAAVIVIGLVGVIDEWHQCYTPGRSGGDPWDGLADVIGAAAGAFAVKKFHRRLQ